MTVPHHIVNPDYPQPDIINAAAAVIGNKGTVIMPTRGLYGLGCDATQPAAVKRIFDIKQRRLDKPLLVLISHYKMLSNLVSVISPIARQLMTAFWPGRLTLVMQGRKGLSPGLCSDTGKIGVRMVGHPVAAALVDAVGRPVTGTSANLAGSGGFSMVDAIDQEVTASVDMVLNAGPLAGGAGSTVVDVTGQMPRILRQGGIREKVLMDIFKQR